ncbi:hypothetical protein GQ53DRAFT_704795 [Thozetella sp. PMI_491]|nr:hypothetical protein GQ53DRAFT_704795 [Thozetella sp. PMI_491]
MIDLENLRTASLYINNQLLSRGLLRDGQDIDFTSPGSSDADGAATMGRIMAVVNDLILRRDRDAEHRETLSTALRTTRAESLRQANDIQRLQEKHVDARRKADLAEAAETALRAQLKSAEANIHKLKEEAARTKTLVAQTRSSCANEVRKRDRQIDGLKKAVAEAGRARGATKNSGITTITVTGELNCSDDQDSTPRGSTATEGYDLRMETNAFLAELAKGLSEDNENLLNLVRDTIERLKAMSGWDDQHAAATAGADGLPLPTNCEEMSSEITQILEHLRTILTNPSFVPIEEVVVREDEINRLRDGWVKMEGRWKEAVHLIDGWRRRMQTSGRPVNMEELKMGLRLSPVRVKDVVETSQGLLGLHPTSLADTFTHDEPEGLSMVQEEPEEPSIVDRAPSPAESLHLVPAPDYEDQDQDQEESDSESESSIFQDDIDVHEFDVSEPNIEVIEQSLMMDSPPLPPLPQITPLHDSHSGRNRGRADSHHQRQRPGDFTTIIEENSWELSQKAPVPPPHTVLKPQPPKTQTQQPRLVPPEDPPQVSAEMTASNSSLDSILLAKPAEDSSSNISVVSTKSQKQAVEVKKPENKVRGRISPTTQSKQPIRTGTRGRPATQLGEKQTTSSTGRPARTQGASSGSNSSTSTVTSSRAKSGNKNMPPPPTPNRSPRKANSRLPLPRNGNPLPPPQQSPLTMATIAAKLAASEREADAARVRAKLKAARLGKRISLAPPATNTDTSAAADATRSVRSEGDEECVDPVKKDAAGLSGGENAESGTEGAVPEQQRHQLKQRKRERRTEKVASRRRSTLNPWELETLIQGKAKAGTAEQGQEEAQG